LRQATCEIVRPKGMPETRTVTQNSLNDISTPWSFLAA
jgi:hypothetical protein